MVVGAGGEAGVHRGRDALPVLPPAVAERGGDGLEGARGPRRMTPRKAKPANLLDHKKASVGVSRNGLVIDVADVTASDAGIVAKALLDTVRELVKAGYDELIVENGGLHSGALGEVPDEVYEEEAQTPTPIQKDKRVGFTQA